MSFAGWEVCIMKNCDRGLEYAAQGLTQNQTFLPLIELAADGEEIR